MAGRTHDQHAPLSQTGRQLGRQSPSLVIAEGGTVLQIETQLGPGIQLIDILSARPRAAVEGKAQFGQRNLQISSDGQIFHVRRIPGNLQQVMSI